MKRDEIASLRYRKVSHAYATSASEGLLHCQHNTPSINNMEEAKTRGRISTELLYQRTRGRTRYNCRRASTLILKRAKHG